MSVGAVRGQWGEISVVPGWVESDSQDNAEATAEKAAATGKKHFVSSISASFSASATKLLQIKDDTTVIWESYVVNSGQFTFPSPIEITSGKKVSAVLAASGVGGTVGKVNITGFTEV